MFKWLKKLFGKAKEEDCSNETLVQEKQLEIEKEHKYELALIPGEKAKDNNKKAYTPIEWKTSKEDFEKARHVCNPSVESSFGVGCDKCISDSLIGFDVGNKNDSSSVIHVINEVGILADEFATNFGTLFLLNQKNIHDTKSIEKAHHIYKQTKNKRIKNKQIKKILCSKELYNAFKL